MAEPTTTQTSEKRHSETPWIVSRRNIYGLDVHVSPDARHDVAGRLIACVNDSYGTGEADAALIVQAWTIPTLLAQRDALLALARSVGEHFADTDAPLSIEARRLIALAESRS